jgi:hypothetical protein
MPKQQSAIEGAGIGSRPWTPVDRHEVSIWLGLTIYIGLHGNSNLEDYWCTEGQSYHRPMQWMCYGPLHGRTYGRTALITAVITDTIVLLQLGFRLVYGRAVGPIDVR